MATTVKRITIALTQEDTKQITELCQFLRETQSTIIKRALLTLYNQYYQAKIDNFNCDKK